MLVSQIQAAKEIAIILDPSCSCIISHIIEYMSHCRVLDLRSNIFKKFFDTWCSLRFFSFELCWTIGILRVGFRGGCLCCLCCHLCGRLCWFCISAGFRWKYYMKPHHRHMIFWSLELPLFFGWGWGVDFILSTPISLSPIPRWLSGPKPQTYTVAFLVTVIEWLLLAAIDTT